MNKSIQCEQCGSPLPQTGDLVGECPRCILELALRSVTGISKDYDPTWSASGLAGKTASALTVPGTIARYRILRVIGEGAMGTVYEAEQDQPRRTVALKIIKAGITTPELLRRFEQESQALGRLQHPGIAQIYEAGTADTGLGPQPYFAMEFIRGKTLSDYAKENHLDTRQRLQIVVRIADAVQHAHQRGLIHRDLKPGNIIVDESGQPRILDFGIARATDSDAQATSETNLGQLLGTLAYMSPEQVLADPLELDTRSDVYALGVILYELLSGRLPYTISKNLHETIHAIKEEDPASLSALNRSYRGDIETIVAKALEKDKTRRYGSAAELAADIHRYLKDEPIVARPPSASYQMQKFARRHKALVAGVAAVFVVLVLGIVASTFEAARARRAEGAALSEKMKAFVALDKANESERVATSERDHASNEAARADAAADQARLARDMAIVAENRAVHAEGEAMQDRDKAIVEKNRADTEAAIAKAVRDFLGNDLLRMADPFTQVRTEQPSQTPAALNPNFTVKEALDNAAKRLSGRFDKQPLIEIAIREMIASTYMNLGIFESGQSQYELACDLRQREQGKENPDTLRALLNLVTVQERRRRYLDAEKLLKEVFQNARHGLGEDHAITRTAILRLVSVYRTDRKLPAAESFLKNDVIEYERGTLGGDHATTLGSLQTLASLYESWEPQPRYPEAELVVKGILESQRRNLGPGTRDTLNNVNLLAHLLIEEKKFKEAEDLLSPLVPDTLVAQVVAVGRDGQEMQSAIVSSMKLLAEAYSHDGKPGQADALLKNVTKFMDDVIPVPMQNSADPLVDMSLMVVNYVTLDRDVEAENLLPKVLEGYRRVAVGREPSAQRAVNALISVSQLYLSKKMYAQAERLFREVMEIQRDTLDAEDLVLTAGRGGPLLEMYQRHGTLDSYEKTEQILTDVTSAQRRILDVEGGTSLGAGAMTSLMWGLSQVYWDHGKQDQASGDYGQAQYHFEKAAETTTELLKIYRKVPNASEQSNTRVTIGRLAQTYGDMGQYEKAMDQWTEVLDLQRSVQDRQGKVQALLTLASIGWVRLQQQNYPEAENVLREACESLAKSDSGRSDGEDRFNCDSMLGASLAGQKKYAEAEPLLRSGYEGLKRTGIVSPNVSRFTLEAAGSWLVRLYEEWGKPQEADSWRTKVQSDKALALHPKL